MLSELFRDYVECAVQMAVMEYYLEGNLLNVPGFAAPNPTRKDKPTPVRPVRRLPGRRRYCRDQKHSSSPTPARRAWTRAARPNPRPDGEEGKFEEEKFEEEFEENEEKFEEKFELGRILLLSVLSE